MANAEALTKTRTFDVEALRRDFPALARQVHGKPLIYFDNAASAQRPQVMIDAIDDYFTRHNANVHRGVHTLSEEATALFEEARDAMTGFINANDRREVIFVRGATEGVNLVAQSFVRPRVGPGDRILISHLEHHSNIVPWQMVCEQTGAELSVIPMNEQGELVWEAFDELLTEQVKMLACVHVSNALGTVNPIRRMAALARERGVPMLVDGAQATPHQRVDVQDLGVDFYCVSGHKMFGPTGIGVLWGRQELLDAMPPYHGGGEMIKHVTFEKTIYNDLPSKFEAGTPNIAGSIGLGASARYLQSIGMDAIQDYEQGLLAYATEALGQVDGVRIVGTAADKAGVLSFTLEGVHPHDLGTILDHEGVAIRTGHHCAMPIMQFYGLPATSRASLAFYNTRGEVDHFIQALQRARQLLA